MLILKRRYNRAIDKLSKDFLCAGSTISLNRNSRMINDVQELAKQ